ncbi:uncharacterized protein LOC103975753 isoform X1 [Musa acuminata AAA Group]|uniref:uncharacterized protein LOC103975753 isoform X1 n=1 Tax=Musa acuminata AAA Group TaxID=214697 RepID=UPI0031D730FD
MSATAKKRPKQRAPGAAPPLQFLGREPSATLFPSKNEVLKLFAVIGIAASVAAACNYAVCFFNRQAKSFCDSSKVAYDTDTDLCEPCPSHGWCSNGKLECFHGYKKQGRKCVEDGTINQTAKKLSELLQQHVCNAYGQVLCNEPGKIWFQEADVREIIDEHMPQKNIVSENDTSTFVKRKVMDIVESILETRVALNGSKEFKCPDLLAELCKPLQCRVNQWIYKHVGIMVAILGLLVGLTKITWSIHQKKNLTTRAEQLYEQVCEILQDNAMRIRCGNREGEPWLVASWLRDQLLRPRERKHAMLWKKVEEMILEDSRIDQYPKMIKGESKVVLEWQVDGPLTSMLKNKESASKTKAFAKVDGSFGNEEKKPVIAGGRFTKNPSYVEVSRAGVCLLQDLTKLIPPAWTKCQMPNA